jgi:hypothetical protein
MATVAARPQLTASTARPMNRYQQWRVECAIGGRRIRDRPQKMWK